MKAVSIIAEYNPFHNGHLYQIKKVKELFAGYPIIVIMSGNFTQRGDVSLIDKWDKAKIALDNGVDLVIELPFPFATQSADIFAYGAIKLLNELKATDIVFGSESNNVEKLFKNANLQINNNMFDILAKKYLKEGLSYPNALNKALMDLGGDCVTDPNDLLGLSYIKEIIKTGNNINVHTIKRTNDFNSDILNDNITSAKSIRTALLENKDVSNYIPFNKNILNNFHTKEQYFNMLRYQILCNLNNLQIFSDVDSGLANKIKDNIFKVNSFDDLIKTIKTKNYTYQRISRVLIHILCNFTKELNEKFKDISYIRVLGFNNIGKTYLNSIKKNLDIPLVARFASIDNEMLKYELQVTGIYYNIDKDVNNKSISEYVNSPIYKEN